MMQTLSYHRQCFWLVSLILHNWDCQLPAWDQAVLTVLYFSFFFFFKSSFTFKGSLIITLFVNCIGYTFCQNSIFDSCPTQANLREKDRRDLLVYMTEKSREYCWLHMWLNPGSLLFSLLASLLASLAGRLFFRWCLQKLNKTRKE